MIENNLYFRAWTGEKMIYRTLHDRNWYTEHTGGKLVKGTHPDDNDFFKVMQYTGIKDKNEVNIYDKDIIKVRCKHGFHSELLNEFKEINNLDSINGIGSSFIGIVEIDILRGIMFKNINNNYKEPMFSRHINMVKYHSDIEVIGNLYQPPQSLQNVVLK